MSLVRALVEGSPQKQVSTAAQTSIGTTAALVLSSNAKRKSLIIQNTGTTTLKFTYGTAVPTQTVYHFALKACTAGDDGSGAAYFDDGWVGAISGISSGAGGTFVLTELMSGSPDWNQASDYGLSGFLAGA